jgi:DNA repair photolyase
LLNRFFPESKLAMSGEQDVKSTEAGATTEGRLRVVAWQRRAEVLTHPKLPCLASFHTINLTAGCPQECRYCYAQSYAHHPGWGTVAYYSNARDKLREELARLRQRPRLVYFSTATEPFLAIPQILDVQYEIMATLLDCGIALLISTKGFIPDRFVELFAVHPGKVHVQVGMTTLQEEIRELIEPRTVAIDRRLSNLERLHAHGVETETRMDPLIPGLTDTNDNLEALVSNLARVGVRELVASFLFLRWKVDLPNHLVWRDWSVRAMRRIYTHKVTDYCGGGTIWLPPTNYRRERFEALQTLAEANQMTVKLCKCKNKDLAEASCCHPIPSAPEEDYDDAQLSLF